MAETAHRCEPDERRKARGPDGQGWNRFRMETIAPLPRCKMKPLNGFAAWEASARPHHWRDSWSQFDLCTCHGECPIAQRKRRTPLGDSCVVREDEDGEVYLMNKQDGGWSEFGYRYASWAALFREWDIVVGFERADEHGSYWPVTPVHGSY